jgi:hypothetical protein
LVSVCGSGCYQLNKKHSWFRFSGAVAGGTISDNLGRKSFLFFFLFVLGLEPVNDEKKSVSRKTFIQENVYLPNNGL